MADDESGVLARRILVLAPFGRDAVEISRVLAGNGFDSEPCRHMDEVCHAIEMGASALLVAEEALNGAARSRLSTTLGQQPGWSDFPVLILTSRSRGDGAEWHVLRGIGGTAHVSLLERPLHVSTLISSVRTAMHARKRQYQIRDALAARERAENELRALNRMLEMRVRERTADLEARNRDLQNFAYVASHDLREPLRKIQTFVDLVFREATGTIGEDARFFLERMAAAALRMDGLLNDLVDFSRVGTKADSISRVPLDELIAEVLSDFEVTIRESRAEIDAKADVTIEGHRPQLRQLMSNLIGNALKFHGPDSPPRIGIYAAVIEVPDSSRTSSTSSSAGSESSGAASAGATSRNPRSASASSRSARSAGASSRSVRSAGATSASSSSSGAAAAASPVCRIIVEDNGVGFDSKFADRIFEPFERLHGQAAYEGTGMGLAICKRIVQAHGGTITAESTPGGGSRFEVRLPIQPQSGGTAGSD